MDDNANAAATGPKCPEPPQTPPGLDPAIANQLTLLTLTGAINQQQLNAVSARSQALNQSNVLTLGVQLAQITAIGNIFNLSPAGAAAVSQLAQAGDVSKIAALQTVARTPDGV